MTESFVNEVKDNRNIIAPTFLGLTGTLKLLFTPTHANQFLLLYNKLFFLKFAVFTTGMGNFKFFMHHKSWLVHTHLKSKGFEDTTEEARRMTRLRAGQPRNRSSIPGW
jgi:hypothetical protein